MENEYYTFGLDAADLYELEAREQREKERALDTIRDLILQHGIDINEITAAIAVVE